MERYGRRFNKSTAQLSPLERWEMLTALLAARRKEEKRRKYLLKWRRFANLLLAEADD